MDTRSDWKAWNDDRHILITGGAGYIGSLLTSELLRANYRVTVLDSLLFGGESIVPFLSHPNFHFIKSDVTEPVLSVMLIKKIGKSRMRLFILQVLLAFRLVRQWGSRWHGSTTSKPRKWSMSRQQIWAWNDSCSHPRTATMAYLKTANPSPKNPLKSAILICRDKDRQ
jgi:hypothetical protein